MEVRWAPTLPAPSIRFVVSDPERHAQRFAHGLRLGHHGGDHRADQRIAGHLPQGRAGERAHRVEAQVAPELQPDFVADARPDRRREAGGFQRPGQSQDPVGLAAAGFSQREAVERNMADHAGRDRFRRRIDDAADRPFRTDRLPLDAARVDGFEACAGERAAMFVKIPPGHAVGRGDDGGLGPQHRKPPCGAMTGAALALTATITASCGPASAGSSVAAGRPIRVSPSICRVMPFSRIAASVRFRAIIVTSVPARASSHPR